MAVIYPPFLQALLNKSGLIDRPWVSWFQQATGGGKVIASATLGSSPATYHNTTIYKQQAFVIGGTVSAIAISRDNSTFYATTTPVTLFPGDYLKITYSGLPTLTLFPI